MRSSCRVWCTLLLLPAILFGLCFGRDFAERAASCPSVDEQLIVATAANDETAFEEALASGASARGRDPQGSTALMFAASSGNVARSRRLLERGAEIEAADQWGCTALMYAARCNEVEVIRVLLSRGADVARRNASGQTARDVAIAFGAHDAAGLLHPRVAGGAPLPVRARSLAL